MGKYLKKQFQPSMFNLEHHCPSDFYLSCWQRNRSPVPLLCVRLIIFLGCFATLLASLILTGMSDILGFWPIFMTHWGLVLNTIASCFAVVVSLRALKGPIEPSFDLPWYVKVFWAFYDIAIVEAFFISIYYYAFLTSEELELAVNLVLDFFIHGANSMLMFLLLVTSRVPGRMLHLVYPLGFGIIYLLFSVVYYLAGGNDPFGNNFIYPTLDWSTPGVTSIMLLVTILFLMIVHLLVVGLTACRNWLARRVGGGRRSKSMDIPPYS